MIYLDIDEPAENNIIVDGRITSQIYIHNYPIHSLLHDTNTQVVRIYIHNYPIHSLLHDTNTQVVRIYNYLYIHNYPIHSMLHMILIHR